MIKKILATIMVVSIILFSGNAYGLGNSTDQDQMQGQGQGQIGINDQDQGQMQGQVGINDQDQGQQQGQIGINEQGQGQQQGIANSGNSRNTNRNRNRNTASQGQGQGQDQGQQQGQVVGQAALQGNMQGTKVDIGGDKQVNTTYVMKAPNTTAGDGQRASSLYSIFGGLNLAQTEEGKACHDVIVRVSQMEAAGYFTADEAKYEAIKAFRQLKDATKPKRILMVGPRTRGSHLLNAFGLLANDSWIDEDRVEERKIDREIARLEREEARLAESDTE